MRSGYSAQTPEQEEYELQMAEFKAKKLAKQNTATTSTKSTEKTKSETSKILLEMQELEQKIPNEKNRQEKLKMRLRLKQLENRLSQIPLTENGYDDLDGLSDGLDPDSYSKNRTGVKFPIQKKEYASKERNSKFATDPQAGKAWVIANSKSKQLNPTNINNINEFTTNNEMNEMYKKAQREVKKGGKRKRRTKHRKKTKKKRRTKRR
tara:strand:+ start:219 stop:842 length:624 start_codon:yes stop_codon:yes gene_type:complete